MKAMASSNDFKKAKGLIRLGPHLNNDDMLQAVEFTKILSDDFAKSKAFTGLIPHLDEIQKINVLLEALKVSINLVDKNAKAKALKGLIPHLNNSRWSPQTPKATNSISDKKEAIDIYRELVEAAPEAFTPKLAMTLNNYSVTLSEVGRRDVANTAKMDADGLFQKKQ